MAPHRTEDPMSSNEQQPADASPDADHDAPHEGPIKTPTQLIWTVVASFVVPIVAIVLLVNYVAFGDKPAAGSDGFTPQAIAERIQPLGRIELRDPSAPRAIRTGSVVYAAQCAACHVAGLAGAPKLGDVPAWAPRIATGYEALLNSVIKGKGAMGAQAGGEYSDHELGLAVVHMVNESGGRMEEPPAPEAPASN
jgi:cytochrome c5